MDKPQEKERKNRSYNLKSKEEASIVPKTINISVFWNYYVVNIFVVVLDFL